MRTRFLVIAALAAAFVSAPAGAAPRPTVSVTLDVSIADDDVDHAGCKVIVDYEADGFDVLAAAVRAPDCIESFQAANSPYGRYLTCIDDICGRDVPTYLAPVPTAWAGTTWTFTVNDAYVSYGLGTYDASAGDEVGLTYSTYAFPA